MERVNNPYPETMTDETCGVIVPDKLYDVWNEGYLTGFEDALRSKDFEEAASQWAREQGWSEPE